MGSPAKAILEQRTSRRFRLVCGQLPGQLFVAEGRQPVMALVVDVSKGGLGVSISRELPVDTALIYELNGRALSMRVVWAKRRKRIVRHGLQLLDPSADLEEMFFALGLVDLNLDMLGGKGDG